MSAWQQENIAASGGAPTPPGWPLPSNPQAGRAASYLYQSYGQAVHGNPDKEAGLQLAIWEVLYEGATKNGVPDYSLGTGNIYFTNFSSSVSSFGTTYLGGIPGNLSGSDALWLRTADQGAGLHSHTQDFIVTPVPESASLLLVAAGLFALAAVHRKAHRGTLGSALE